MWALTNAITSASTEGVHKGYTIDDNGSHGTVVRCLLKALDYKTSRLVANSLESLELLQKLDQQYGLVGTQLSVYQKMKDSNAPYYLDKV